MTGRLASTAGKWSSLWSADLINWHAHIERRHDTNAWSPHLLAWRGQDWLSMQRLLNSAFGESRTNTRIYRGKVHRRWEDGLERIPHFC